MVWIISAPVNGSAKMEMSGTSRVSPGTERPLWNDGRAKVRLAPPPAPNWKPKWSGGTTGELFKAFVSAIRVKLLPQPVWNLTLLSGFNAKLVPPIPVAKGELAG